MTTLDAHHQLLCPTPIAGQVVPFTRNERGTLLHERP
jgi:hypothetical protein